MPDRSSSADRERQKQATIESWDRLVDQWDAWTPMVDAWFEPATTVLLQTLELAPGKEVLEVAAGTGGLTKHLARAVVPRGRVVATDSGPQMVQRLARNAASAGLSNVTARLMDMDEPDVAPGSVDAVACRQGFMFLSDPAGAFRRYFLALRPGGALGFTVFSTPERNRCLSTPLSILSRWADPDGRSAPRPDAPGPFSLGSPGKLEELLPEAGFRSVRVLTVPCPLRLDRVEQLVEFYRELLPDLVRDLPRADQELAWGVVAEAAAPFAGRSSGGAPCELMVASGRRPMPGRSGR
jgi:ubiquinone/menaquinone biosynthesis C-methylase UbiE